MGEQFRLKSDTVTTSGLISQIFRQARLPEENEHGKVLTAAGKVRRSRYLVPANRPDL
jgi:hypothetical protein